MDIKSEKMLELAEKVRAVTTQLVGEVSDVRHSETSDTGEEIFTVMCHCHSARVTVTLNPNGKKAVVEWKSGRRGRNYKVCDVEGLASLTALADTAEDRTAVGKGEKT